MDYGKILKELVITSCIEGERKSTPKNDYNKGYTNGIRFVIAKLASLERKEKFAQAKAKQAVKKLNDSTIGKLE